ncbi:ribonuclease K6-like [Lutra lutra]|uniref:ribonuclease K6-like n=1 Tax=Lutra lutra TaxID=9657 RepID=UPI001FD0A94D|nr:ribonuclease K6-like [Lutra lutra]
MLDLLGPFPLLLVLLGSWEPVSPLDDWAQSSVTVQTFMLRHLRPGPVNCQTAMPRVNLQDRRCKPENTFLHDTLENVAATCGLRNMTCRNGRDNCYRSRYRINMTYCNRTRATYPNCSYSTTLQNQFYVVACECRQPGFPPNRLLPVHLDETTPLVHLHFG